jgi:protein-disulfide isomerase
MPHGASGVSTCDWPRVGPSSTLQRCMVMIRVSHESPWESPWASWPRRRSARRSAWLAALAFAGTVALGAGCKREAERPPQVDVLEGDRYRVELFDDDIAMGADDPLVTIVVFTDYACPPCGRTWQVMEHLLEHHAAELRVVYRTFTVPGFPQGEQAAEAALAAEAQDRFWPMHRRLFETQAFDRPSLRAHAETLGLDVERFMDELDTGTHAARRFRHRRQAVEVGVAGLPASFVNGAFVPGFRDEQAWSAIIEAEIVRAKQKLAEGTPRKALYEAFMAEATERAAPVPAGADALREELRDERADAPRRSIAPDPTRRYHITGEGAPFVGPEDAPVLVVTFMDLSCPYCRRAWDEELEALVDAHPEDVRLVVRALPLEIHRSAEGAAKAILAADRQGKFRPMFDRLIRHEGGDPSRADFVRVAAELGLDEERFLRDLDDPAVAAAVQADVELAQRVGVTGTPGFFVNGRYASGFNPGLVPQMVAEELSAAAELEKAGVPRGEIVAKQMADAVPEEEFPNR